MLKLIHHFLTPPVFAGNDKKTNRAKLLHFLVTTFGVVDLGIVIAAITISGINIRLVLAALFLTAVVVYLFVQQINRTLVQLQQEIDERKQTEQALQESEEHFRNLVEGSLQGIYIHSDMQLLFANQACAEIHGYASATEFLALDSLEKTIAPHELERLRGYKEIRTAGGEVPSRYEYQAVRQDGLQITLQNEVQLVNWQGEWVIQGTVIDISEQKRAEKALHAFTHRLRILREIDEVILAARSSEEVAHAVLTRIKQIVPCQRAGVTMVDLDRNDAFVLAAITSNEAILRPGQHFTPDPKLVEVLTAGQVYIIPDFLNLSDPYPYLYLEQLKAEGLRSFIGAPLITPKGMIGVLSLLSNQPHAFAETHSEVLAEVASPLSIALTAGPIAGAGPALRRDVGKPSG